MPKLPVEEYFEHLQTLDLEGKIKYLLDAVAVHRRTIEQMEKEFKAHMNTIHEQIEGSLDCLKERCNIHQKEIDKLLSPAVAMLIKQTKAHMEAHQALMEAREAGKCKK